MVISSLIAASFMMMLHDVIQLHALSLLEAMLGSASRKVGFRQTHETTPNMLAVYNPKPRWNIEICLKPPANDRAMVHTNKTYAKYWQHNQHLWVCGTDMLIHAHLKYSVFFRFFFFFLTMITCSVPCASDCP